MTIASTDHPKKSGALAPLALITIAAFLVRLWGVNQGFWYDEIFSLTHFFRADWITLVLAMPDPNHHPLYSLLAKLGISVLGEKEWSARLPALVAGTATVPLLYIMGERLLNRRAGTIAALLMSFNMWHVFYSTDARGYSLMVMLSLASWFYFLLMARSLTLVRAIAYVAVTAAALYTHLYCVGVPLGHLGVAVVLAAFGRQRARREYLIVAATVSAALVIAAALYSPMIAQMIEYVRTEGRIIGTREFSGSFVLGLFLSWASGADELLMSIPMLLMAAAGLFFFGKDKRVILFSWLLPLSIGLAIPLASDTFVYHRFYAFAMPGFFLAAGYGVDSVCRRLSLPGWAAAAMAALLIAMLLPALHTYNRIGKQGLRPAAQWINENAPGAKVISLGLARNVFQYYCPEAIALEKDGPLEGSLLANSVVVFAFPWSVKQARQQRLDEICGEPLVFQSAGYRENEVRLYRCNPAGDGVQ